MNDLIPDSVCKDCGAPLMLKLCTTGVHYASKICVADGHFNGWQSKPDAEKINRPAAHRNLAIKFGYGMCELCQISESDLPKGETLTGHHVEAKGGEPSRENVRVYCTSCHEFVHWLRAMKKRIVNGRNSS